MLNWLFGFCVLVCVVFILVGKVGWFVLVWCYFSGYVLKIRYNWFSRKRKWLVLVS